MASQNISHYRIISKLGEGGMGEVYLAEDTKLDRKVAIKFLPPATTGDEKAKSRLIREAQAAARLDHPNICAVHEVGEEEGRSFIVMQYRGYHHLTYELARIYALGGKNREALKWLRVTVKEGFPCYPLFARDSFLDAIRKDPAVIQFLAEMKTRWEGYQREFGGGPIQ